jgi:hypothetical protein
MTEIELAILPTYLRHLARLAENAPHKKPRAGECPTVAVPVDVKALRAAADIVQRYIDEEGP